MTSPARTGEAGNEASAAAPAATPPDTGPVVGDDASKPLPGWLLPALGALALVLAAIAYRALVGWTPGRLHDGPLPALYQPSHTSPEYIAALSALFLWMRIGRLRAAFRIDRPEWRAWPLVLAGCALFAWSLTVDARDLQLLSFVALGPGLALAAIGPLTARALLLPFLFLLFAVPLPAPIVNHQTHFLQTITSILSTGALEVFGLEVFREGNMMYTRERAFHVIETCSGLRMIETLTSAAIAYGELMGLRRRDRVILFLLAPLIAIALNTVRVLAIIFSTAEGPASDHTLQGLAVIVVGVLSFAVVERILLWLRPPRPEHYQKPGLPERPTRGPQLAMLSAGIGVLALLCLLSLRLSPWPTPTSPRWAIQLPPAIEGFKARLVDIDEEFFGSVRFSRYLHREYEHPDGRTVGVVIAKDDRLKRDRSALSPKTRTPGGGGWQVLAMSEAQPAHVPGPVEELLVRRRGEVRLVHHWREGNDPLLLEGWRAFTGIDVSPFRPGGELRIFHVNTRVDPKRPDLAAARERLERFGRAARDGIAIR